jgi:hypothetical protein
VEEPQIKTAIPRQRYQVGPFTGVVLGEIETSDPTEYRYILAMVEDGQTKPGLFVTAERNRQAGQGAYRMRVLAPWGTEVLGASDRWKDIDAFIADAFSIAMAKLALTDEMPVRLA